MKGIIKIYDRSDPHTVRDMIECLPRYIQYNHRKHLKISIASIFIIGNQVGILLERSRLICPHMIAPVNI